LVSTVIKNWDNKTWLSSKDYINSFNKFLIRQINLNSKSRILDIGCGRGKILGNLSSKLKLKSKPLGIDIIDHRDRDKRISFKKKSASIFFLKNKEKFDLILIKQTIHLMNIKEIKKLLNSLKRNLNQNGKIFIFTLDANKNELPTFDLMKKKLIKSLKRDKKIIKIISDLDLIKRKKFFIYKVEISKKNYLDMIKKKYISTLLTMSEKELSEGIEQINSKYAKNLKFKDKLTCIILQNPF
jgi:ubiquinone/menaquinone biosynthesis C-methylase UbiE